MPTTTTTEPPTPTQFCVDVNNAPQAELEELGGISPALALLIIANRPYESVQDFADLFGPGVLAAILLVNPTTGAFASDACLTPVTVTTSTTTSTSTTTTTTAPPTTPPTIQLGNVTAVCVSNIPFFAYEILNFPEGTLLSEIRFENPEPGGADLVYVNQPLTGQVLWPGASADPEDWPGWILNEDGIWVEGDDGFLWARESVQVTFTINPSVTVTVTYPPASAICAGPVNPAITTTPGSTAPDGVTTTRAGVLPFTGSELLALGYLAGATFLLGLILLVSARKQES